MDETPHSVTVTIPPGTEYRIETEPEESLAIRSLTVDPPLYINYQELPPLTWYPLYPDCKLSVWNPPSSVSPNGAGDGKEARLEISTEPSGAYVSSSSTFPFVQNLHLALEKQRILAKRAIKLRKTNSGAELSGDEVGPRVMVLGGANAGKTTLIKSLVNLALSSGLGWGVGVAGLDPSNPPHLIPGTLSLSIPLHPTPSHHPSQPLGPPPSTTPATTLSSDVSTLGWFLGTGELKDGGGSGGGRGGMNWVVWRETVEEMGRRWRERCERDELYRASGLFIDTHSNFILPTMGAGKNDRTRYGLVRHAVECFDVNVLLVIGNEKLTVDLERFFPPTLFPRLTILRVPKSSGTVDLDSAYHSRVANAQTKSYFYGEPEVPLGVRQATLERIGGAGQGVGCKIVAMESGLHPYSYTIGWDDLEIYRVGQDSAAPSSAMPIGQTATVSPTRLTRVDPSAPATTHRLQNAILGLVPVSDADKVEGWREREEERKTRTDRRERRRVRLADKLAEERAENIVKSEPNSGTDVKQEIKSEAIEVNPASISAVATTTGEVDIATGQDIKPDPPTSSITSTIAAAAGELKQENVATPVQKEEVDEDESEDEEDEEPVWKERIAWREVAGFLALTRIDTVKRKYEVLTPSPGKLPSMVAIVGNVEWAEEDN